MLRKLFGWVIIIVAIIMGLLMAFLFRTPYAQYIIFASSVIEVTIPLLAVGALINYIWHSNSCCKK